MEPEAEVKLYIKYQRDVVAPLVAERRRLLLQYVFNVDGAATEKAEVFFTLIFAVLLVGANFYMRPEYLTIAISNLNFNFPPLIVHR